MSSRVTYLVRDTFNQRVVSRHLTIAAALRAERAFLRSVRRANGRNSYIPTEVVASDGSDISDAYLAAQLDLINAL